MQAAGEGRAHWALVSHGCLRAKYFCPGEEDRPDCGVSGVAKKGKVLRRTINNQQCFCSQVPQRRARAKSLPSVKSTGTVLPQQVNLGLDQGDKKLNLHFNMHMLSPPGNSPHAEPPEEIICASGKNNPRRAAAPAGRPPCGRCVCGWRCCRAEELRGRARLLGKVSPGESIKMPFS